MRVLFNHSPSLMSRANPEDGIHQGFTGIPNELLEHLAQLYLRSNDWQVLVCIIRRTLGWHKEADYIANSQIMDATGLGKAVVSRSLGELQKRDIVIRKKRQIGIQQDWQRWRLSEKQIRQTLAKQATLDTKLAKQQTPQKLAKQATELAKQTSKVSDTRVTQKKTETVQKKPSGDANKSASQIREVFKRLKERNWDTPNRAKEAKGIKWMLSKGYAPSAILMTYDRLKGEAFWSVRFLSMIKVAEQIGEKVGRYKLRTISTDEEIARSLRDYKPRKGLPTDEERERSLK